MMTRTSLWFETWFREQGLLTREAMQQLEGLVTSEWPELGTMEKNTQDDPGAKQRIGGKLHELQPQDLVVAMEKALAKCIELGNKANHWRITMTPFSIEEVRISSLATPYNHAGLGIIQRQDKQLAPSFTVNASCPYDPDTLMGQVIYLLVRECHIASETVLIRLLTQALDLTYDKSEPLSTQVVLSRSGPSTGLNRDVKIFELTETLLRLYRSKSGIGRKPVCLLEEKPGSRDIMEMIGKAIDFPKIQDREMRLKDLLAWSNYSDFMNGMPGFYCHYARQADYSYSTLDPSLLTADLEEPPRKTRKTPKYKKSDLTRRLVKFSKHGSRNDNEFQRLKYAPIIAELEESILDAMIDDQSVMTLDILIAKYILDRLKERQLQHRGITDVRPIAMMTGRLLHLMPFFQASDTYGTKGMLALSEDEILDATDRALSYLSQTKATDLYKDLEAFYGWCHRHDYLIDIPLSELGHYCVPRTKRIRPVLVTPRDYSELKRCIATDTTLINDGRHRKLLTVMLILATRLGLRRFELCNLTLLDFRFISNKLVVHRWNHKLKSNNATRKLNLDLLSDEELTIIRQWYDRRVEEVGAQASNAWLFTKEPGSEAPVSYYLSTDRISKLMKQVLRCESASIHWLRHTAANWLWLALEAQTGDLVVSRLKGFDSPEFSDEYQQQCTAVLLGHTDFERPDAWGALFSLVHIMAHANPDLTMQVYVHTLAEVLASFRTFDAGLTARNVEYLLDISKRSPSRLPGGIYDGESFLIDKLRDYALSKDSDMDKAA